MKVNRIWIWIGIGFLAIGLHSCTRKTDDLEESLRFAGKNRKELEKVLQHYQQENADSLKLLAAKYLIINMPHYYSLRGWVVDSIKHTQAGIAKNGRLSDSAVSRWNELLKDTIPRIYDSHVITAGFLIDNIDNAFRVWKSRGWSKRYCFKEFCEYILPYRIGDEPLENWRSVFFKQYTKLLDSVYQGGDVVEAARIVANQLKKEGFSKTQDMNYPHLGGIFLFRNRSGRCRETCDIGLYAMRALGIPVAVDKYIISPSYRSQHFWNVIIDTNKKAIPFLYNEEEISRNKTDQRKKGKVYRETFGYNPEKYSGLYADKKVPPVFRNPYLKDVSEEYFNQNSITLPVKNCHEKYLYLGVFDGQVWVPITIAEVKDQKVVFKNLEKNIIYQVISPSDNQTMMPCNFPFLFKDGKCTYLIPDTATWGNIRLTRKYPFMSSLKKNLATAIGIKIEVSDDPPFNRPRLLFTVKDTPNIGTYTIRVRGERPFRYARYSAPADQAIQLAELHFYRDIAMKQEASVKITSLNPVDQLHESILNLMSDHDPVSFYMSAKKGERLLFDLGSVTRIKEITFSPRNDGNFVSRGDGYDLFYQTDKGWKLIGSQTAVSEVLWFNKVPKNALFWLHDKTRGNEDQVFIYRNNRQVFNYDL